MLSDLAIHIYQDLVKCIWEAVQNMIGENFQLGTLQFISCVICVVVCSELFDVLLV